MELLWKSKDFKWIKFGCLFSASPPAWEYSTCLWKHALPVKLEVSHWFYMKACIKLGAVACACNPSFSGGQGGNIWSREFETSLGNIVKHCLYKKCLRISQVWWNMPVVSENWGVEAGGFLVPRSLRLQWTMISPLHSGLGDRARPCLFKKQNKRKLTKY